MASINVDLYNNESFKQQLMTISTDIVWKNSSEAKDMEVPSRMYLSELFMAANRGMLSWSVCRSFPRIILKVCGVTGLDLDLYSSDKNKIPEHMRASIVAEYQKALCAKNPITGHVEYGVVEGTEEVQMIDDSGEEVTVQEPVTKYYPIYTEENDYYRMLNGLPGRKDKDYVYNTDPRWDTKTPIHEMRLVDRLDMEAEGVLDQLIKAHPTKKYLKYCGKKMVDLYTARAADRFEILWINSNNINGTLLEDFRTIYDGCKNQVNAVYYTDAFKRTNQMYDNFMAMCVLFMSIQTMMYRYLTVDIVRDFYDINSLKYVYDSYNVPFYSEIPLEYHRRIVKNINRLIGYKGSSKVFIDLFGIFDMAQMSIYSYYLTKKHKMDSDGNPIFIYKKDEDGNIVLDEDGKPVLAEDQSAAYSLGFSRAEIYQDPALAIADPVNDVDGQELTELDPYWVTDQALIDKLNEESFDFTESKYIGVQTTFDLLKIAYENVYLFKMIVDNHKLTDGLIFRWPEMSADVSVYDLMLYMAALFCKAHNYEGNILPVDDSGNHVKEFDEVFASAALGYDFKENVTNLQKYMAANPYISSDPRYAELNTIVASMKITDLTSVSKVFDQIYEIRDFLIDRYTEAHDMEEFETYKGLYDTLMTSHMVKEAFTKSDGEVATTFADMLADSCMPLANRLGTISTDIELEDEMHVVIDKIEEVITSCRYMPFSAGLESSGLFDALFKILKFFKSAKAELSGYNIVYRITMRGINFFKLFDKMVSVTDLSILLKDDQYQYDLINFIRDNLRFQKDILTIYKDEPKHIHGKAYLSSMIQYLRDQLTVLLQCVEPFTDDIYSTDFITSIISEAFIKTIIDRGDNLNLVEIEFAKVLRGEYRDIIESLTDLCKNTFTSTATIDRQKLLDAVIDRCYKDIRELNSMLNANDQLVNDRNMSWYKSENYDQTIAEYFRVYRTLIWSIQSNATKLMSSIQDWPKPITDGDAGLLMLDECKVHDSVMLDFDVGMTDSIHLADGTEL